MNQSKIDALQIILNNEVVMAALREVFDTTTEETKPTVTVEDDALLGQRYRAYDQSRHIVDLAFKRLKEHRKEAQPSTPSERHI